MSSPDERALREWLTLSDQLKAAIERRSFDELAELQGNLLSTARALDLPVDVDRDDTHVFLEDPRGISTATWTQCGGVLRSLLKRRGPLDFDALVKAVTRVAELAPTHR